MNLMHFKGMLGEAYTAHAEYCAKDPEFSVRTEFGVTALYIECHTCGEFQAVI